MAVLIFWAAGITSAGRLAETVDAELIADAISRTSTERCKSTSHDISHNKLHDIENQSLIIST